MSIISFAESFRLTTNKYDQKLCLISYKSNKKYLYGDFKKLVLRCNSFFSKQNLKKGDCILVSLNNSVEMSVIFFSALVTGLKIAPCYESSTDKEILRLSKIIKPKLVLTSNKSLKFRSEKIKSKNIVLDEKFSWLTNKQTENYEKNSQLLIATSGTTGAPKVLVIKSERLWDSAKSFSSLYKSINPDAVFWNFLSMSYLGGLYNLLIIPFQSGATILITGDFDSMHAFNFWDIVKKYKINVLWLVPSIVRILIKLSRRHTEKKNKSFSKNINLALVGTAPIDISEKQDFKKVFNIKLLENYGLSETTFISYEPEHIKKYEQDSVGEIINDVKIKIDKKTKEILVSTPYLFLGYLNQQGKLIKKYSQELYFPTGDLGVLSNNTLFLKGRAKDIVKKAGYLIYLKEIENLIYKLKNIKEAAAVAIKDEIYGENYVIFYTTSKIKNIDQEIRIYLEENLSRVKLPAGCFLLPEIPKTRNGKIIKSVLTDMAISYIEENKTLSKNKDFLFSDISKKLNSAVSIDINQIVYNMKRAGKKITTLSLGEAYFDIPQFDFKVLDFKKGYHYSDTAGIPELRNKIASYYLNTYKATVFPSEVLISAGSKPLIFMVMKTILNANDQVLVHEPAWLSYEEHAKMCNAKIKFIPYQEKIENFQKFFTKRTKLFILNNPNNPGGKVYTEDEIRQIYSFCQKNNTYLMIDEAYSDFMRGNFSSLAKVAPSKHGAIIINSLSKNLGISGWRIGYVICNQSLREQLIKFNQHLITCAPTILSMYVDKYFDLIIPYALKEIKKLLKKRVLVEKKMKELKLVFLSGTATFYYFINIDNFIGTDIEFINLLLTKYNISAVPGSAYGRSTSRFIRISIGTESLIRINNALSDIRNLIRIKSFDKKKLNKDLSQWQFQ